MGKNKRGICMADGGITRQETADELMARMTAKYGAPAAGPAPQQPAPVAQQQAAPKPAPQQPASTGLGIMGILRGRKEAIDKATNFANGGIAAGAPKRFKFEGDGGPREDKVPVKVAGQNINVSDGEQALIVPAKTAANAQAMKAIQDIIAGSNDGRQPDMGNGAGPNFSDGGMTDEERAYRLRTGNIAGPDMRGMAAGITSILPKESPIRQWAESGQQPASPAPVAPAAAPEVQAEKPAAFKAEPFGAKPEQFPTPANSDGSFMTGKDGARPDSSGGGFVQKDVAYNVNPTNQEGITKITSTKTNPLYTNIKPEEATAGLKNQMVGGDAASVQEGLSRHARANAITQSIIDKQPVGGVSILGDGGVGEINDERTARWRQDELLSAAKYGNRAAGDAIQANAHLGVEGIRSATTQRGQDVGAGITMRGQDLTANTEANRLAVESPLKQAQTQGIMAQNDSASMMADIQKKALAGDQQALASYQALTGKNSPSYKAIHAAGGQTMDGKNPDQVFVIDERTGNARSLTGGQAGQVQAPAAAIDYLKKNPNQAAAFKAKYGYLPEGF